MTIPQVPNQQWSVDCAHDTLIDSRHFRLLAVIDDFTCEYLGLGADTSLSGVRVALFSANGAEIVTACRNGVAKIWDAKTGKEIATLNGHKEMIEGVAFSPDSERLVTASRDTTAMLWDAKTGKQLAELKGHAEWLSGVEFNHDGTRIVTSSSDKTARVWDGKTGALIRTLEGHDGHGRSAVPTAAPARRRPRRRARRTGGAPAHRPAVRQGQWPSPLVNRSWEARTSASASVRPTHSAPSTDLPGSRSL